MGQSRSAKPRLLKGVRVLVVEDEFLIRLDLEESLRAAGAEVFASGSIGSALETIESAKPLAAILDVRVGKETIASVARRLTERGIPFLFYTGQAAPDPALVEWQDHKIIAKPAQPKALIAAVVKLVCE